MLLCVAPRIQQRGKLEDKVLNSNTDYNNDTRRNTADISTHRASYLHVGVPVVRLDVVVRGPAYPAGWQRVVCFADGVEVLCVGEGNGLIFIAVNQLKRKKNKNGRSLFSTFCSRRKTSQYRRQPGLSPSMQLLVF